MSQTSALPLRTGRYHVPKKAKIRCEAKNVRLTTINRASHDRTKKSKPSTLRLQGARGRRRFEGVEGGRGKFEGDQHTLIKSRPTTTRSPGTPAVIDFKLHRMFLRLPAPVLGITLDGFDTVGCLAEIKHKMASLRPFKHLRLLTGTTDWGQGKRRAVMLVWYLTIRGLPRPPEVVRLQKWGQCKPVTF
jgi:hypothetical protein